MKKDKSEGRRKLLKSIAAGSGAVIAGKNLPDSWSRPVVDSVMLPAHAQMSGQTYAANGIVNVVMFEQQEESMLAKFVNAMLPEAHAGGGKGGIIGFEDYWCATLQAGIIAVEIVIKVIGDGEINGSGYEKVTLRYNADVPVDGSSELSIDNVCEIKIEGIIPPPISVNSIDEFELVLVIGEQQYTLKVGPCALPSNECVPSEVPSDVNIKENFSAVDEQEILEKVANLRIEHWNYNDRADDARHIGPMAQDFMAAFNVGGSDKHIHMVDANGVNMAAIKALNAKLEYKDAQIEALQHQLKDVIERLDKLGQV